MAVALAPTPPIAPPAAPVLVRPAPRAPVTLRDVGGRMNAQVRCPRNVGSAQVAGVLVHQVGDATATDERSHRVRCVNAWRTLPLVLRQRPASQRGRWLVPGPAVVSLSAFAGGVSVAREVRRPVNLRGPVPVVPLPRGVRWRLDPDGDDVRVAGAGSLLVVTSARSTPAPSVARNRIRGVDPDTGAVRWRVRLPSAPSQPVLTPDGLAVVATAGGRVLALDAATGAERWHRDIGFSVARPAVSDGVVVLPESDDLYRPTAGSSQGGNVVALDTADGARLWHTRVASRNVYAAAADGTVALATVAGGTGTPALTLRDLRTGAVRWSVNTRVVGSPPARGGGLIVLDTPTVEARDAATGAVRWRSTGRGSDPVVTGDLVMAGLGYEEAALDLATGVTRWRATFGDNTVFPVADTGAILVPMGGLWRLNPSTGQATLLARAPVFGIPALTDHTVVAGGVSAYGFPRPTG